MIAKRFDGDWPEEVVTVPDRVFFEYWQERFSKEADTWVELEEDNAVSTLNAKEVQRLEFVKFLINTGRLKS